VGAAGSEAADWLRIGCGLAAGPRGAPDGRGVSASQTLAGPYWISRADSKGIQYLSIVSPLHPTASGWMAFISLIDQSRSLPNNQRPDQSRLPGPRPVSCGPETGPPLQGTGTQTGGGARERAGGRCADRNPNPRTSVPIFLLRSQRRLPGFGSRTHSQSIAVPEAFLGKKINGLHKQSSPVETALAMNSCRY
jgi:hypothetical protein